MQMLKETHMTYGHVFRHDGLVHEITGGRMRGKPTRGRRRLFKYTVLRIWQMMMAMLHSNGQQRAERYGDTE